MVVRRVLLSAALACAMLVAVSVHVLMSDSREDVRSVVKRVIGGVDDSLNIGVGIHDVTGPAAEINMMGYAHAGQNTAGIHFRTRARAFVFESPGGSRVAFVSVDAGMASQMVTTRAIEKLQKLLPGKYTNLNVCIAGTHTHSAPAGFLQYTLYQVTSLGYNSQTTNAFADGIAQAIAKADANLQPATLSVAEGLLADANINRSPSSYVLNPAEERARYVDVGNNTDHNMVLLRINSKADGKPLGMVNWYAVHATSMNNTNKLISGDNKGYASLLFEKKYNPAGTPTGKGAFVGAFANTNLGDVSPNTRGAHCQDTGLPCDTVTSTCNGKNELCVASGPGTDMFDSTRIIGEKQFEKAVSLFESAKTPITGPVNYRHQFVNMPTLETSTGHKLCSPAMGYSFAAGTTDGPGAFDFKQSTTSSNPFWNFVSHILAKPSAETEACHAPKPILLDTGDVSFPYAWQPSIVPIQIFQIGQLVILGVPGEFTTMAGRRLRAAVKAKLVERRALSDEEGVVVIAGLANTYSSYITTYEEYQAQRYEAASTIYGPHTLEGYIEKFVAMAGAMAEGKDVDPGPTPPDFSADQHTLQPGVIMDGVETGKHYGDVSIQPAASYRVGQTASAEFRSGNPRNNLRTEDTFLTVERKGTDGQWTVVATDGDWETKFHWERHGTFTDRSFATVSWTIPEGTPAGTYRLRHFGDHKSLFGGVAPFSGASNPFSVTA